MLRQGKQIWFTREFSSEFCAIDRDPSDSRGGRHILVEVKAVLLSGFFSQTAGSLATLFKILLVVFLCAVEFRCGNNLGHDGPCVTVTGL